MVVNSVSTRPIIPMWDRNLDKANLSADEDQDPI